ncbi:AEC family transporter [Oxalobacteraceae bacterium R-40]|uniref:AEC family transporter n=1 Tax=Keguizhuia sedimenti TaxID=3064264 RepID=A0ABU1BPT3_9BURK|nr:AEC family transporter [Oxalobacteraceae bacterium R-40]
MDLFERIAGIILPVFVIVAMGYGYARLRRDSVRADMVVINRICMDVLAPLLVFTALAAKDFDLAHHGELIVAGVLISIGSGVLAWPLARLLGYDVRSFVPPMMYNNCGNMGLPLAAFAFGPSGLSAAVALFMASNLVYFSAGIKILESGRNGASGRFFDFLLNPMMLSMLFGTLFAVFHIEVPATLFQPLKLLGETSIPLMLFALGVRMLDINFNSWRIGLIGAAVCPLAGLLTAALLENLIELTDIQRAQMYLFASLPPAVFCFVMAERYQQEPNKVASIVLLGNLASLVFVPLGLWAGMR